MPVQTLVGNCDKSPKGPQCGLFFRANGVDAGAEPNDGDYWDESEDNYAAGPATGAPSARFVVSRRTIIVAAETRNSRKTPL